MEMHQVRYFLAVARTLNFTRAAEECNVAQPSLTRAVHQLEEELGGDLFRRERPHAQLTELGQRMMPLMRQCYDSALGACSLASSMKSGEVCSLRIALSHSVDLSILMRHIEELRRYYQHLELKLLRGTADDAAEFLKQGHAELALASSSGDEWERLDKWPLYTEGFQVVAGGDHRLAGRDIVTFEELRGEPLLVRGYCEHAAPLAELCRKNNLGVDRAHELNAQRDLVSLLEQGFGITLAPRSELRAGRFVRARVDGLDLRRTIFLYGVAGRQRSPVANLIMKMLRSASWSQYSN
jgi:DNA-binding transcriptional LysR family regulator